MTSTTSESRSRIDCKGNTEISDDITFVPTNQGMYLIEAKIVDEKHPEQSKSITRAVYVGKKKLLYDFYIGGTAGIIALIGLESISLLFTESFFQPNTQNIITH